MTDGGVASGDKSKKVISVENIKEHEHLLISIRIRRLVQFESHTFNLQ